MVYGGGEKKKIERKKKRKRFHDLNFDILIFSNMTNINQRENIKIILFENQLNKK